MLPALRQGARGPGAAALGREGCFHRQVPILSKAVHRRVDLVVGEAASSVNQCRLSLRIIQPGDLDRVLSRQVAHPILKVGVQAEDPDLVLASRLRNP